MHRLTGKQRSTAKANSAPQDKAETEEAAAETAANTVHRLRADIVSGALEAGARLRFSDLQNRYETGTSPLREALSRLAGDRLVVQEINRGFRVPTLSRDDFDDIAALRLDLETKAFGSAIVHGGEAWEEGIVLAHHRLRRLGANETGPKTSDVPEQWEERHRAFHGALVAACTSPWTLNFCMILNDQFDRYRRWAGRDGKIQAQLSRHHTMLAEAAVAHDEERGVAVLTEHIAMTAEAVRARLA